MAPRLTVVVSQSAQKNPVATDLEESLVAELMMKGGMDATMIGPLEHIQTDDTDFLCLSSFNYNFALVSWMPAKQTQEQLDRLGLTLHVVNLADPAEPSEGSGRRVLHLQLGADIKLPEVMSSLETLLAERAVKPVGIAGIGLGNTSRRPAPKQAAADGTTGSAESVAADKPGDPRPPTPNPPTKSSGLESALNAVDIEDDDEEWDHLEQLVDDLDDADL